MDNKQQILEQTVQTLQKENTILEKTNYILRYEVIDKLPCHVYWKDRHGVYLGCNILMAKRAGYVTSQEITGKTDLDMEWAEQYEKLRENDQYVMRTGKTIEFEEIALMAGQGLRSHLSRKTPLRDRNQKIIGILGISVDVTDTKKKEALQVEMLSKEKLIDTLKTIAGALSHDLRTPLSGLYLLLQRAEDMLSEISEHSITAQQIKNLLLCHKKMEKQIEVTRILIDLQLGNLQKETINTDSFTISNIETILNEALEIYPFRANEYDLVHCDLQQDFQIWFDPLLFKNVIWNLLQNALHFIREVDKGDINIWLERTSEYSLLHFKDTGTGMSPKVVEHIFERFYSTRKGGTGIGLSFCKLAIEAGKGKITCGAKEGEYTHFTLYFPIIE